MPRVSFILQSLCQKGQEITSTCPKIHVWKLIESISGAFLKHTETGNEIYFTAMKARIRKIQ
jgi:hypothetical protein